jgi:hypothetical protein
VRDRFRNGDRLLRGAAVFAERNEETFPILTGAQIARVGLLGKPESFLDGAIVYEPGQSNVSTWY